MRTDDILIRTTAATALLLATLTASQLSAQGHDHAAKPADVLGSVHFATSCAPAVAPELDRAVAYLHSFEFGAAIRGFTKVLGSDSTCAMAYWGIALSRWGNPMAAGLRAATTLEPGRHAATMATRVVEGATERERAYVAAVNRLYESYETVDQRSRVVAYANAMANLVAAEPADTEAKVFYALSLVAAAPPTDKTYASQMKAGAMLEKLWAAQPNHPGLAHYIIHAYDVPALAPQAKVAAARYADIAPSAAHALHMPSHTFTRVGMWQESVNTNLRSLDASLRDANFGEALHASDYAEYAYLQMRKHSAAKAIVTGLPTLGAKLDPNVIAGAASGATGGFAIAAIPARYALERRAWTEAAALVPKPSRYPQTEAMTYFARSLGASHLGKLDDARASIDSLGAFRARLRTAGEDYWAEQVAIQQLGASAWLAVAEHRDSAAVAMMREAAKREDATEKSAVTPGPLAPAHELLGDLLLQLRRPQEALVEYRASLAKEPNRYRSLDGAMQAAGKAGDRAAKAKYAKEIAKLTR